MIAAMSGSITCRQRIRSFLKFIFLDFCCCVIFYLLPHNFFELTENQPSEYKEVNRSINLQDVYESSTFAFNPTVSSDMIEWKQWLIKDKAVRVQGNYGYAEFIRNGKDKKSDSVCLATQTTLNGLSHVVETSENWRGPMVVTLFVPGIEFTQAKIILRLLYHCSSLFLSDIKIYFAWPLDNPPIDKASLWMRTRLARCNDISLVYHLLEVKKKSTMDAQNSLRNIASKGCETQFVMVTDVDMIPTPDQAATLQPVLKDLRSCNKCAFLVPVYGIDVHISKLSDTKQQLVHMVEDWQLRRAHQDAHKPAINVRVKVAYPVTIEIYKYEPIYIIEKPFPAFDDKLREHGLYRTAQIHQMVFEGYKFFVLDNVFLRQRDREENAYSIQKERNNRPQEAADSTYNVSTR